MTGIFAPAPRDGQCVFSGCTSVIQAGDLVYLWHKLERQTVCLTCAHTRWGYEPSHEITPEAANVTPERIGFDSTKAILKSLQSKVNQDDGKIRQLGGDR